MAEHSVSWRQEMWWRRTRKNKKQKILIVMIEKEALERFERLANDMNADNAEVLICALSMLEWIVRHAKEGGILSVEKSGEGFEIFLTYKNRQGKTITMPPQEGKGNTYPKPRNISILSESDKHFFREIGIDPGPDP